MDPATQGLSIAAATADDLATVARLAGVIWRRHYPGIITREQIDYMLARGYADAALRRSSKTPGAGLGDRARRRRSRSASPPGVGPEEARITKLDKLYVLQELHGRGVGRRLIAHVEAAARADGAVHAGPQRQQAQRVVDRRSTAATGSRCASRWSSTSAVAS